MALKITYDGHGEPLRLLLEKDGIVVKCMIKTQNPDMVSCFNFDTKCCFMNNASSFYSFWIVSDTGF